MQLFILNIMTKNLLLLILFSKLTLFINAQNNNFLKVDILPVVIVNHTGTGIQLAWQKKIKNQYFWELNYGITYDFSNQSGYDSPKASGLPIGQFTTEINVKDAFNSSNFALPDKTVIDGLNQLGFKQVTPYKSYRLDNYGILSVGKSFQKRKNWAFSPQLGVVLGMANRAEFGSALTSNLGDNPFIGTTSPQGWVVFQIYSRYWYLGLMSKINIERQIRDNLFVGITTGANYIFDSHLKADDLIFYTGLSLKVGF